MVSDFSNILVCVDNSTQSQKALVKAISIAEKFDSEMHILMVIEGSMIDFWDDTEFKTGEPRPQIHLKKDSKIFQQSQKILNNLAKRVPATINCKTVILSGEPANVIINYSKKNKPSLIVLGTRGLGGFSKLLLGSVASKVSEHVKSSVLIIK